MTATPDQVIAQIREALEAGPTPGEWVIDDPNSHLVAKLVDGAYEYICAVEPSTFSQTDRAPHEDDANARFIAACNPQNIAVLLAEREALLKGLAPFAAEAPCYDPDTGDGDDSVWATPVNFKIRDLRRARTLSGDKS